MEFFHKVTTYPFMHTRRMWYGVSSVAIIASAVLLFWHGLNLGIDFTGGVVLEFQYPQKADLEKTRATLEGKFTHPQVQNFGDDRTVAVRLLPQANEDVNAVSKAVTEELQKVDPQVKLQRAEVVGPQVGQELTNQGGLAILFTFILIGLYTVVPLPVEDGHQRDHRHAARSDDHSRASSRSRRSRSISRCSRRSSRSSATRSTTRSWCSTACARISTRRGAPRRKK
jgi:hypothetical protein